MLVCSLAFVVYQIASESWRVSRAASDLSTLVCNMITSLLFTLLSLYFYHKTHLLMRLFNETNKWYY